MTSKQIVFALVAVFLALAVYVFVFQMPGAPLGEGSLNAGPNNGVQNDVNPASQDAAQGGGNAKINVAEVCAGALAYMTFPDGAAADAFVQACIAGEHPEVIERFKADMGLGAGAAI